jgi:hypothetical protein
MTRNPASSIFVQYIVNKGRERRITSFWSGTWNYPVEFPYPPICLRPNTGSYTGELGPSQDANRSVKLIKDRVARKIRFSSELKGFKPCNRFRFGHSDFPIAELVIILNGAGIRMARAGLRITPAPSRSG